MKDKIKDLINKAPSGSGVYHFVSENGASLYVGKAKNLRKRLLSYTIENKLSARISHMVFLADNLEITNTTNELEALLLEHNLIKKLAPKYNILLRDDKTFPLIAIDKKHRFGAIKKHRGLKDEDHFYFGPFASGLDVNRVIDVLRKSFLLRNCSDTEFKSRKKPCLEYQIKKCSGPCVGLISQQDYSEAISNAVDFLSKKSSEIQAKLAEEMQKFSALQHYEKAALVRDKIKSLSSIQAKQNINLSDVDDKDVISLVEQNNQYCVYISFYRGGNNYGSKPYFYSVSDDLDASDFLDNFLGQFYLNQTPPKILLLNISLKNSSLMEEFLSKIAGEKVEIKVPKQGDKMALIQDQEQLARSALQQKIEQNLSDKKILHELKEVFELTEIPQRIEVYDNSHTATQNAVGAMIVAGLDGFVKNAYRKYNIRFEQENSDDTAMMKEVLERRFKGLTNETLPSLVIIDGGLPQLSAVKEIFAKLKLQIPFICMAKGENRNAGEEKYHLPNGKIIELKKASPLAFYLQRLRDEAHRFAITTHRAKRAKSVTKSRLDEIEGIGAKRKKALLNYFGSVEKIKQASIEDLMRVEGISKAVASSIWKKLR